MDELKVCVLSSANSRETEHMNYPLAACSENHAKISSLPALLYISSIRIQNLKLLVI